MLWVKGRLDNQRGLATSKLNSGRLTEAGQATARFWGQECVADRREFGRLLCEQSSYATDVEAPSLGQGESTCLQAARRLLASQVRRG